MYTLDTRKEDTSVESILRRARQHIRQEPDTPQCSGGSPTSSSALHDTFENLHIEPELHSSLDYADRIYDPRSVPGNTRFRLLKGLVMRVLRLYTTQQVEFNATILRILNSLFEKLHDIIDRFSYFREAEVRLDKRIEEAEAANSSSLDTLHAQRQRIERLEDRESILDQRIAKVESLEQQLARALNENSVLRQRLDRLIIERAAPATPGAAPAASHTDVLNDHLYLPLLNADRCSEEVIRTRVQRYLPFFSRQELRQKLADPCILDMGCGRGEFLDVCRDAGLPCRGVDINDDMVGLCTAKGHTVVRAHATTHLRALADASVRGIAAIQIVEHFTPADLLDFLKLCALKIVPGGRLVIETPDATSLFALTMFYRDFTHQFPVHPASLTTLLTSLGFAPITRLNLSPVDDPLRLDPVDDPGMASNIKKLNDIVYGTLDYALLAEKPGV